VRALKIEDANFGPNNPQSLNVLLPYEEVLGKLHEDAKASEIQSRVTEIEKKQAGH
jgi:hypothetical protein